MSELSSLYVIIQIRKERLIQFFNDRPEADPVDNDWLTCWKSRNMYNKPTVTAIPVYPTANNGSLVEELVKNAYFGAKGHYEETGNTYFLMALQFSENYTEILLNEIQSGNIDQ
ncbi:hypothetical protein [Olivibacter domesticus]|uniref:Uncharacterized protein n=1 Tax=Olivibacter domesticus TaxID=407022 RepID=A0A1H7ZHG2_OLID1|nr:hypothetical protein [Olivibacter domesticus]SEM56939.1 hypothetical protein SAMN05661044_05526 [Olivibacter domesticus]